MWAAVAVMLVPSPDSLLLIRRARREGDPWSGHMALPGGRCDPQDSDLIATVIREVGEEVGISLERGQLITALDDVVPQHPTLPPVAVRPHLFLLPARPSLTLNLEVSEAVWVPLDRLLSSQTFQSVQIETSTGPRDFPAYRLGSGVVWGMTERILTALLDEIRRQES
ncbi:MAG: CoA pyrophosphatase [Gemmatimonadales bacterium]